MSLFTASAPGRCGIVGNPSDIYGGKVLSCSLPTRNRCRLRDDAAGPDDPTLWRAATHRHPISDSIVPAWSSEVPRSSGLAGSTALLAATLACVLASQDKKPDLDTVEGKIAFAELVRDVERHDARVMCGYQDAYMAVFGGLQLMDFHGKHPIKPGPSGKLTALEGKLPFLLVTTGVERLSGSVHGPMAQRWLNGEEAVVEAMDILPNLAVEGAAAVVRGDYTTLGRAMDENQRLIASLGGSGDAIDHLIERCVAHGAISAKLAGAGMGGTVIALVEDDDALEAALREDGYSRFIRPEIAPGLRFEAEPSN